MTTQHTPGPWVISPDSITTVMEVGPLKRFIAHATDLSVKCSSKEYDERDANARLIAAAPELYELLIEAMDGTKGSHTVMWQEKRRAAIAKATGAA